VIKIGKPLNSYLFLSLTLFTILLTDKVSAQDYDLRAVVSENRVFTGEQFTLTVEVSGGSMRNLQIPIMPDLNGVRVLSSTPSRGTNITMVNGRTTTTITYSYTLLAQTPGNFTIPPIDVVIDGEARRTSPVQFEIIERSNVTANESQLPDIFARIELDRENPVPGQQVVASLVLYFKQGLEVTSFQPSPGWRTDGFWKEELENIEQPRAESTIFNNVRYRQAVLLRYALFPTRSGSLTISPFTVSLGVRTQATRNDPFGSFFGGMGTNQRRISVDTEPIQLEVRTLPRADNALTIGAVGDLSINRNISTRRIVTGETVELTTTITGEGSIPLISRPMYDIPEGFEAYAPQENSTIQRRGTAIRGTKTFTEVFTTRTPGRYTIPEARIAVFNPVTGRYRYTTLPEIYIVVDRDASVRTVADANSQFALQPITGLAIWRSNQSDSGIILKPWFWVMVILPGIALLLGYKKKALTDKLANDASFARAHKAWDKATSNMSRAKREVSGTQPKLVYHFLYKAVTGYISDRLRFPEAGWTDAELISKTEEACDDQNLIKNLKKLLTRCSTISYAPIGTEKDISMDVREAEELLNQLKSRL
jgi:hypothetical protein